MEFYHLRSFVVVAKTGNLTQAAKQLCTTPPAISAHIKSLELELNTSLFERSHKGMLLTEKGHLLLEKAQHTLDSVSDMVNLAVENQSELFGTFHLGLNQGPAALKLSELASNLRENCPGIHLLTVQATTGSIVEDIRAGKIDGGYIYGEVPADLYAIRVKTQKISAIAPLDISIPHTEVELAKLTWVKFGDNCPFDHWLSEKLGSDMPVYVKSNDEYSRAELVAGGAGLSFVEWEVAESYIAKNSVQALPELDFDTALYFVVAKANLAKPLIKALLQEIRALWNISWSESND